MDIERLLSIETLWKARKKPIPLDMTEYREALQQLLEQELSSSILTADTKVWTILKTSILCTSPVSQFKTIEIW